ncbi:hypothetical protein KEM52_000735, partial [Ascosphaera acerosa]
MAATEGSVYRARDYLSDDEFARFIPTAELQALGERVRAAAEWLDGGEGEGGAGAAGLAAVQARLEGLRGLVNPALRRRSEAQDRPAALAEIQAELEQAAATLSLADARQEGQEGRESSGPATEAVSSGPDASASEPAEPTTTSPAASPRAATAHPADARERQAVAQLVDDVSAWLTARLAEQRDRPEHDDPALTVAEVRSRTLQLQKASRRLAAQLARSASTASAGNAGRSSQSKRTGSTKTTTTTTTTNGEQARPAAATADEPAEGQGRVAKDELLSPSLSTPQTPDSPRKGGIRATIVPRSPVLATAIAASPPSPTKSARSWNAASKSPVAAETQQQQQQEDEGVAGPANAATTTPPRASTGSSAGPEAAPAVPVLKVDGPDREIAGDSSASPRSGDIGVRAVGDASAALAHAEASGSSSTDHDRSTEDGDGDVTRGGTHTGSGSDADSAVGNHNDEPPDAQRQACDAARSAASEDTDDDDTRSHTDSDYESDASCTIERSGPSDMHEDESLFSSDAASSLPPSAASRQPYSTLDPDKIAIEGVYLFERGSGAGDRPVGKLEAGRGSVTDGLILRVTTEGMFIDDDVRGVAERDWDVKAWTMRVVEVWCPVLRGRLPNYNHAASSSSSAAAAASGGSPDKPRGGKPFHIFRRSAPAPASPRSTEQESARCLLQLFQTCRETCYELRADSAAQAGARDCLGGPGLGGDDHH